LILKSMFKPLRQVSLMIKLLKQRKLKQLLQNNRQRKHQLMELQHKLPRPDHKQREINK